jgi:hypothetical protein
MQLILARDMVSIPSSINERYWAELPIVSNDEMIDKSQI